MPKHDSLFIENVRCFTDQDPIPLAPLTLLVGENSTGKSTFLAMCRLGWDVAFNLTPPDFNEEPFFLGSFGQIANYREGRNRGKAKSFQIGWETVAAGEGFGRRKSSSKYKEMPIKYMARFSQIGSQPIITERSVSLGDYSITARFNTNGSVVSLQYTLPNTSAVITTVDLSDVPIQRGLGRQGSAFDWEYVWHLLRIQSYERAEKTKRREPTALEDAMDVFAVMLLHRQSSDMRPYATAPVRTKPERTYNPINSLPEPEGGHVPMVLAKTFIGNKENWDQLKETLDEFGVASGLFNSLDVRPLGKKDSDPFQLKVRIAGPAMNLIDVGYGVSQVLPIVVDTILGTKGKTFLFQQPEVHLHPKGQAQLGTFLARFAKMHQKRFVVETHSDYLLDRVRMDVRDKKNPHALNAEDIMILFFEWKDHEVSIHKITLDEDGNLVDVPAGYRQFFLQEESRFLGL